MLNKHDKLKEMKIQDDILIRISLEADISLLVRSSSSATGWPSWSRSGVATAVIVLLLLFPAADAYVGGVIIV